jgi:putative transposase
MDPDASLPIKTRGFEVGRTMVQSHMREMDIPGIIPSPNLSKRLLERQVYPYLLKNLVVTRPIMFGALILLTSG